MPHSAAVPPNADPQPQPQPPPPASATTVPVLPPSPGFDCTELGAGPQSWLIIAAAALVAAADILFWGHGVGWTLGGYALALLAVVATANLDLLAESRARMALAATAVACLALIETPSILAACLYALGLATFLVTGIPEAIRSPLAWAAAVFIAGIQAVTRVTGDVRRLLHSVEAGGMLSTFNRIARAWALPVLGAGVFLALFALANPIVDSLLQSLDPTRMADGLPDEQRILFWLVCAALIWLVLRTRLSGVAGLIGASLQAIFPQPRPRSAEGVPHFGDWLFSDPAIVRSMLVFNVIFALQNGLDAGYLWGDRALPAGFTFAAYAHRGAYPLMVTALLAAAFVLIAFRPGSASERDPAARRLMYLWIAQNVVLVASSMWRMILYVEAYSLTHARVAVLAWMGLVAVGLVLIVARFMRGKSNNWLVGMNLVSLGAVFYVAAFADISGFIARYNVAHSREVAGKGLSLDLAYMRTLGPTALPAVRRYADSLAPVPDAPVTSGTNWKRGAALALIADLERATADRLSHWRTWTFQLSRLTLAPPVRASPASQLSHKPPASTRP